MTIGINATAAVKQPRSGVEEYTYQLIKHLTMLPEAGEHRFLLYAPTVKNPPQPSLKRGGQNSSSPLGGRKAPRGPRPFTEVRGDLDFPLPSNFEIKVLRWPLPFFWTQIRLAWEMWRRPPDVLFIPVHILPFGAPENSVVTIHGLEYEYFPQYYSLWRRLYLQWSTKRATRCAKKIIAISENTKNDLVKLYGGKNEKIEVVHHGVSFCHSNFGLRMITSKPYILYIGRIETKKNIQGIFEAYNILKEEYNATHELVLAGSPGYGYNSLKSIIRNSLFIIQETGYVPEDDKWRLLSDADIFLFPSFYEGFGLSVLEAQAAGVPVITSNSSCLSEIAGQGALFVNPKNPAQIAEAIKQVIDDKFLRDKLIQSGYENVKRFDWGKCARETLKILLKQ